VSCCLRCIVAISFVLLACNEAADPPPPDVPDPESCLPGELALDDGRCLAAGQQESGCAAGEVALESGGCRPAGIAACGEGFAADERGGCTALLPAAPCAAGSFAVPGETTCHEVAPCAAGTWGDIPVSGTTEFVDAAYTGGASDGTPQNPWTTIQDAVDAAVPGAVVAIAQGSYAGDILITGKAVRLWGRCPALVNIAGAGEFGALDVRTGADGTEIHDVSLVGDTQGLSLSGSQEVSADRVWIHDTAMVGIIVVDTLGPTSIHVTRSLIDSARDVGVFVDGSDTTLEGVVIRNTMPNPIYGWGVGAQYNRDTGRRANVSLRSSVIEGNRTVGVFAFGSDVNVETTVVARTEPPTPGSQLGWGMWIEDEPVGAQSASATVHTSVIDSNHEVGVFVRGAQAALDNTVVRATLPQAGDQTRGIGIQIQNNPATGARGALTLSSSLLDQNHVAAVVLLGSDGTIEATRIRDTLPQVSDNTDGRAVGAAGAEPGERTVLTLRSSLLDNNSEFGVSVLGSDIHLDGVAIRDTKPQQSDRRFGQGISVQAMENFGPRSSGAIRSSWIERNFGAGIAVFASDVTVQATLVRDTTYQAAEGTLGDGLAVENGWGATAVVVGSRIENNARAGIASFGSHIALSTTLLECNAIHLDGEVFENIAAVFENGGAVACGCADVPTTCAVRSSNLSPPAH